MKKTLVFMLTLVLLAGSFASCKSSKENYTIMEVSGYDFLSEANHQAEIELGNQDYSEFKLIKTKTITINGMEVTGTYQSSNKSHLYRSDASRYEYREGDILVLFDINKKTGQCDSYSYYDQQYLDNNVLSEKSRNGCLTIAQDYLKDYISDSESYTLIDEKLRTSSIYQEVYEFEFVRTVGTMLTCDKAYIHVTIFGDVVSHLFTNLGDMKNVKAPSEEEMAKISEQVNIKLDTIYDNVKDQYDVAYEQESKEVILIKLENGDLALEYYVSVQLTSKSNAEISFPELCHFIVYLE